MKRQIMLFSCWLLIFATSSNAQLTLEQAIKNQQVANGIQKNRPDLNNYEICIDENFNGKSLDRKMWSYRKDGFTEQGSTYLKKNAQVKDGYLHLITDRYEDRFSGVNITTQHNEDYHFKYGYFEIRAKLPQTVGNVGAFWLQSNGMAATHPVANTSVYGAEIDILEYSPTNKDNLYHSLHWNGYDLQKGAKQISVTNYMAGISSGYHSFALEWTPKEYIIYVDSVEKLRSRENVSHAPEYVILGCGTGGFGGALNFQGPWPDSFSIDYIKVYKRKPEVRVYEKCGGFGWVSDGLQPGEYLLAELEAKGFFNDAANAIEIPEDWEVIVFEDDNFNGASATLKETAGCLEELLFTNKISSLKIRQR